MKISVLGCGRWGGFLSWYSAKLGHDVTVYGREGSRNLTGFMRTRSNGLVTLPETVKLTSELDSAMNDSDIILLSVPSQELRSFAVQLKPMYDGKPLVLCMKGLEAETGKRLTEIMREELEGVNVSIWAGPGHVQDFLAGIPNCMVIDSYDNLVKDYIINAFSGGLIRFYYGNDMIGNELGAASKNVMGIAAGILDGLNMKSLKGALMSRGTREISRLIVAAGGSEHSAYGLCHLGDYEATLFSPHSHNRNYGESFVRGECSEGLAEGVMTVKALLLLEKKYGVELPICEAVNAIIHEGCDAKKTVTELFERSLKNER